MRNGMLAVVVVLSLCASAEAQQDELLDAHAEVLLIEEDTTRALALSLAKVCANESSLFGGRPADCALIWQTVRRRGETNAERLAWLRAHSSCVLTDRSLQDDEQRTNCRWTRGLTDSDAQPEGWPEHWSWERAAVRWDQMRRLCASLVAGQRPHGGWPCERDPDTWGGRMDAARALRAGMRPVDCEGTLNTGYQFARRRR